MTDFSISPPTPVFITPPFMGGCLVDAEETLAAVGNYQGNTIALYDLTNPASPALISTYDLSLLPGGFGGIGALSLNGKYVLVGEAAGPTIVLLDISQPPSSAAAVASTITNNSFLNGGVLQIVLKGVLAVAAGNYDCYMFDFTNPAALQAPVFVPTSGIEGPYACAFDGSTAAFGSSSGLVSVTNLNVQVFSITSGPVASLIGRFNSSSANAATSVAVMVNLVAVNFIGDGILDLINLGPPTQSQSQALINTGSGNAGGGAQFPGPSLPRHGHR